MAVGIGAYRGGKTRLEVAMSAQPDHAPVPSAPLAPTAAAQLLAQLRVSPRAEVWVPAFEQDWTRALEDSRHSYSVSDQLRET
ncbi:hypothetical protein [Streptomyces phaeochromogenes]|uniref:hypothetical protein n=1 Tax=Streptomyces phaeochromogenes TaxID=1923 RepID=UPI00386F0B87|nr:hypothetical protein OG277_01290 [Streptomyces phaeochromogenes]